MEDGYNMKRILYIAALIMITLTGCNKNNDKEQIPAICGQWKSVELSSDISIFLSFDKDGTFQMYQHVKDSGYELYNGQWNINSDILSGKYNDDEEWAYTYEFHVADGFLTLKPIEGDEFENVFISYQIPDVIKETSVTIVKSSNHHCSPWL